MRSAASAAAIIIAAAIAVAVAAGLTNRRWFVTRLGVRRRRHTLSGTRIVSDPSIAQRTERILSRVGLRISR